MERYSRQTILKEFGVAGQQRLAEARVLVVGAGGLGCPALLYLAGAGIGHLGIVDDDIISESNLHRQLLFCAADVGKRKVDVAKERLLAQNPTTQIETFAQRLDQVNALEMIKKYDYVLDGTDNIPTKYILNDACVLLGKTLLYGAASQYEGQVAVLNCYAHSSAAVNYRDIFPVMPAEEEVPSCADAGVIGVLPGIIGTLQASEIIKLIVGIGRPLVNRLLTYSLLNQEIFTVELTPHPDAKRDTPATAEQFSTYDYGNGCLVAVSELRASQLLAKMPNAVLIDVREKGELPEFSAIANEQIPLSLFDEYIGEWAERSVIFFCQSGVRSKKAAERYRQLFPKNKEVYSVNDSIYALLKQFSNDEK